MPNRLRAVESYALYYGMGGEEYLSRFDLAIVDPGGRTPVGVKRLTGRGVVTVAYVSALEVPRRPDQVPPPNVLRQNGTPMANETFNNWILDPRASLTRRRLNEQVERSLSTGYEGVFLDCLDDVESPAIGDALRTELLPATAWLVAEAAKYNCIVIQNWGLHQLLPMTAHLIDGLCYEHFPYAEIGPIPALHSGIRRLQSLRSETGLRVLALNHGITDAKMAAEARSGAERCGFLWYGTTSYTELPTVG